MVSGWTCEVWERQSRHLLLAVSTAAEKLHRMFQLGWKLRRINIFRFGNDNFSAGWWKDWIVYSPFDGLRSPPRFPSVLMLYTGTTRPTLKCVVDETRWWCCAHDSKRVLADVQSKAFLSLEWRGPWHGRPLVGNIHCGGKHPHVCIIAQFHHCVTLDKSFACWFCTAEMIKQLWRLPCTDYFARKQQFDEIVPKHMSVWWYHPLDKLSTLWGHIARIKHLIPILSHQNVYSVVAIALYRINCRQTRIWRKFCPASVSVVISPALTCGNFVMVYRSNEACNTNSVFTETSTQLWRLPCTE